MELSCRKVGIGFGAVDLVKGMLGLGVVRSVVLGLAFLLGGFGSIYGQTAREFLRQKKTQDEYLLKQLAYLKLYAGQVKEGYDLVSEGLSTIKGFTSAEFELHSDFFGSLVLVNPLVRSDKRVAEVMAMQGRISQLFAGVATAKLDVEHLAYLRLLGRGVELECEKDLEELLLVISSSVLQMSDEQRLTRLEKVHRAMVEKLGFAFRVFGQVEELEQARKKEAFSVAELRRLYGRD